MAATNTNDFDDVNHKKVLRQFLILPILLGTLLVATGITGILVSKKLSNSLVRLNDTALSPTTEYDQIARLLNQLSQNILRLNKADIEPKDQQNLVNKINYSVTKIGKLIQEQVSKSDGLVYQKYLTDWNSHWEDFAAATIAKIENYGEFRKSIPEIDEKLNQLIENIGNVHSFIQADVKDIIDQSEDFSKNASSALIIILAAGCFIGMASSLIIVTSFKKLFLVIADGKKNIETLLNNLDQGFLVFDKSGVIQNEVSRAANSIFGQNPSGKKFAEVIPTNGKGKEKINGWLELIYYENGLLRFADHMTLAPKSFEKDHKYIELDFRPIYKPNTDGLLDKVICIASDKTEERRLRNLAAEESQLVKIVMAILSDRSAFIGFVVETRRIIKNLHLEFKKEIFVIDNLLRGMHSLKGGFAAFEFINISKMADHFESLITDLKTCHPHGGFPESDLKGLYDGLGHIELEFEYFLKSNEQVFGTINENTDRKKILPVKTIHELCHVIHQQIGKESQVFKQFVDSFILEDFAAAFKRFEPVVSGIAERQFKKVQVQFISNQVKVYLDPYLPLISSFVHIFRNAIDHGIEKEEDRKKLGKSPIGVLKISFELFENQKNSPFIRIAVTDDGSGIDCARVKLKAVEKGLLTESTASEMTAMDITQLVFTSGFSTRDTVSDLSGRGVGLDAVRMEAKILGGDTRIESALGTGTTFIAEVPLFQAPVDYQKNDLRLVS